jgi:hypothetical protein
LPRQPRRCRRRQELRQAIAILKEERRTRIWTFAREAVEELDCRSIRRARSRSIERSDVQYDSGFAVLGRDDQNLSERVERASLTPDSHSKSNVLGLTPARRLAARSLSSATGPRINRAEQVEPIVSRTGRYRLRAA